MSTNFFVLCPLILTILLSKISFSPLSNAGLSIALPLVFLVTVIGLASAKFRLHTGRLVAYLLLVAWACIVQVFGKPFSLPSLCFMMALFFPYVLQIREEHGDSQSSVIDSQSAVATIGSVIAVLGCLQYFGQYIIGPVLAFPIEHFLPSGMIIQNYNYLNPLYYGSSIYKSNGIFFLEPSFYSQFLAISLVLELTNRSRPHCILLHLAALACTFSGTGVIVLTIGIFTLIVSRKRFDILIGVLFLGGLVLSIGELMGLNIFLSRVGEFSSVGSSGFERFVSWLYLLEDKFWSFPDKLWTGHGAGTFYAQQQVARYPVFESSFAKIIFEFGLPGAFLFFGFVAYCVCASRLAKPVKAALLTCVLMNGAYSESIAGIYLTVLLWPASQRRSERGIEDAPNAPRLAHASTTSISVPVGTM